ncbi:MAG: S41 family peptidase [Bacteroidales bacterium]|nr:S41 family peptidase [Bacteroidales bacterium]
MKRLVIAAAALLAVAQTGAQNPPLWMRYSAISPDGTTIAFAWKGDLFTVPVGGGTARQITSNAGFDSRPVWSPDSRQLAFASDRMGSLDVYVVSAQGGTPRRLTTHSGSETPIAFKDNQTVLYSAALLPDINDRQFPSSQFPQVYEVSTEGGRARLFSSLPMEHLSFRPGDPTQWLFHDKKGYEDPWRKHEVASISRNVWLCTEQGGRSFRQLTSFAGEDRNPVWAPDGKSFYYLSEEDGTSNVYRRSVDGGKATQVTRFEKNPVRFLSVAATGTLCYGWNGEIYTQAPDGQPKKVDVTLSADNNDRDLLKQTRTSGATEMVPSPDGKEVAFILHGDVYVTSTEYGTTKRITNTPQQERNVQFAPDGRSLAYASERDGVWQIYQSSLTDKEDKLFTYANEVREERLTQTDITSFEPKYSPDGKEIAFLEDRTTIRVIHLKTKAVRTVMEGKYQYSYSDGDQWFEWSPDSRWILSDYIATGGWNNKDVVLLNASGNGEMYNLTQSGYNDGGARWALDGKAMVWQSDRAGYRSHGSWGAEQDAYIMFFDAEAYDRFCLNKEDSARAEEAEKKEKEEKEKAEEAAKKDKKGKKDGDQKDKKDEVKPLTFDLDNCRDRVRRLTVNSSHLGDGFLSPKGDKFYYQARFEGGSDLWVHDLKENSTKILLKGAGGGLLNADKKGENLFLCSGGGLKKIKVEDGKATPIDFKARFDYRPAEERTYIFDHAWRQVKDKFYVTDLHGTDWNYYRENYARFLPYINNNYDFAEMLSEMLGELNGSHTGCRYYSDKEVLPTASLGVYVDTDYEGDGLRIAEIIAKSPLALMKTEARPGCVIEQIDGTPIRKGEDYYPLLEGKVGEKIRLSLYDPTTKRRFDTIIKGVGSGELSELMYHRWVERNRAEVERLSDHRVGYVHIKGMDSPSFRTLYSELLGRYRNYEAVVIDTRHNGGGWLHDDVVTLLGGKEYQQFVPRGQYIGSDPFNKWLKPSCMLVCEDNYSNACGTPWVYKTLGLGKLVGTSIPGTMTAVWWERQIDPSLVFGIPQVGCRDMNGVFSENTSVAPDIEVFNRPEDQLKGIDTQLETAVRLMLETLKK